MYVLKYVGDTMKIRRMSEKDLKSVIDLLIKQSPKRDLDEIKEHVNWHFQNFKEFSFVTENEKENKLNGILMLHPHIAIGRHKKVLELEEFFALNEESKKLLLVKLLNISKKFEEILLETDLLSEIIDYT